MRTLHRVCLALLAVTGSAALQAAPTVPLISGQPRVFTLGGSAFTNSFYIDVPASSQRLTLQLTGGAGAGDLDLLLSSAAPFPDLVDGAPPSDTDLFDAAQYRSASVESNERLSISRANVFPVRAARWYVSILNFAPTSATPTLTATLSDSPPGALPIEVVFNDASSSNPENPCSIAEWNDASPRAPIPGNAGTTLGAQRQNGVREAIRIIGDEIKSDVPIRLQACWANLGSGNSFTVAKAGPRDFLAVEPWLPRSNTWFAVGPATKQGGATQCGLLGGSCTGYDIRATFNNQVDSGTIQGDFHYGTSARPPGSIDFIAVALHEISHGLGFISTINTRADEGPVGQRLQSDTGAFFDDAFGHNLVGVNADNSLTRFMAMTDAQRAVVMTSGGLLRWDEQRAVESIFNNAAGSAAPLSYIFMHTPFTIEPGSTLSHVATRHSGDLMQSTASGSQRMLMLAGPMLQAVGWSTTPQGTPPPPALPASNNLFDARRDGHGIDFVRVRDSLYVLTFYTYGANGEPEWFQAVGNVVNGVFAPTPDANGKTLFRYRYTPGNSPPQQVVPALSGTVTVDFNSPATQAPCNDGRSTANVVGVMTFTLGADQNVRWCMEPVIAATARATPDFSGLWNAASADDGWGWSVLNFRLNNQNGMSAILFYYDGAGNSSFAFAQSGSFVNGAPLTAFHRRGYCRTCPTIAFNDQPAGSATFTFTQPSESVGANNRVTYGITPQNSVGGLFARTNSTFALLTRPQ